MALLGDLAKAGNCTAKFQEFLPNLLAVQLPLPE